MKTLNLLSFLMLTIATITLLTSCATANRQPDVNPDIHMIMMHIKNGEIKQVICYGQPVDGVSFPIPCHI